MAGIPREHTELYFDKLCRTQKAETVFSLIQATYHSKKSVGASGDVKAEIARRLQSAYDLFRDNIKGTSTGAGTYSGVPKQFESQYTIGHELCIWKNSNLDLIDLAEKVAIHQITIKDYFDIFFYNYFQPVDGKAIHPFYLIIKYMIDNDIIEFEKDKIPGILGVTASNENINALCNFLDGTNNIEYTGNTLKYVGSEPLQIIIRKCNIRYLGEDGLILARQELDTDEKYAEYITTEIEIEEEGKNETIDEDKIRAIDESKRLHVGTNIILYGVPGAGKSYTIDTEYTTGNTKKERVVFHPDYTYSDFVGQILPKSEGGNISYDFIPGPFTKIMRDARNNPEINYILVIEEINRGNAPAIFGDIFQLLDRRSTHNLVDGFDKYGESMYGIYNSDVAKIVYGDESHEVKIPSNLSIICTMNTSDQNVFTLDTAFQRRWNMRLIENSFKKDTKEAIEFAEQVILDTSVSWEHFCDTINNLILEKNQNMTSSEDKRLGTHFVNLEDLIIDINEFNDDAKPEQRREARLHNRKFPEKVIKYLWDDAFKFYREEIFNSGYNSLEQIIKVFTTKSKDDRFDIFKDTIKADIVRKRSN